MSAQQCAGAASPPPGHGGALDASRSISVSLPPGSYTLCLAQPSLAVPGGARRLLLPLTNASTVRDADFERLDHISLTSAWPSPPAAPPPDEGLELLGAGLNVALLGSEAADAASARILVVALAAGLSLGCLCFCCLPLVIWLATSGFLGANCQLCTTHQNERPLCRWCRSCFFLPREKRQALREHHKAKQQRSSATRGAEQPTPPAPPAALHLHLAFLTPRWELRKKRTGADGARHPTRSVEWKVPERAEDPSTSEAVVAI